MLLRSIPLILLSLALSPGAFAWKVKTYSVTVQTYGFVLQSGAGFTIENFESGPAYTDPFPAEWGTLHETTIHYDAASAQLQGMGTAELDSIGLFTVTSQIGLFASYGGAPYELLNSANMDLSGVADPTDTVSGNMDTSVFDGTSYLISTGDALASNNISSIRHKVGLQLGAYNDLDTEEVSADAVSLVSITFWLEYEFTESQAYIDAGSPVFVPEPRSTAMFLGVFALLLISQRRRV